MSLVALGGLLLGRATTGGRCTSLLNSSPAAQQPRCARITRHRAEASSTHDPRGGLSRTAAQTGVDRRGLAAFASARRRGEQPSWRVLQAAHV